VLHRFGRQAIERSSVGYSQLTDNEVESSVLTKMDATRLMTPDGYILLEA
jgi:hypothetical protein